ncbi:DUF4870 domain-containing protein [Bacillus salitolerans]|uniref:DUF4870 domain-containing protein n=1 Tax=Bacillus salitolerans TaxID=1437434 RepID=A0ABW4LYR0_9BACI
MNGDTNKLLSALCYFSIFFAGFILPIVIYFIVSDREVKDHAKGAFLSHVIPLVTIPVFVFGGIMSGVAEGFFIILIIGFIVTFIVNIVVVVWNVIKGIQVLRSY